MEVKMPTLVKIADIMTKDVFTVNIDDTIHKADEIMRDESIRQVPVVDGKKFIGLITERTLMEYSLRRLYDFEDEYGEIGYNKINDFKKIMTTEVYLIYPEDSIKKAIELMIKKKVDCLPVVDWENNLVGIVTYYDMLLYVNKILNEQLSKS
jgi:CBS domain-containing protein